MTCHHCESWAKSERKAAPGVAIFPPEVFRCLVNRDDRTLFKIVHTCGSCGDQFHSFIPITTTRGNGPGFYID